MVRNGVSVLKIGACSVAQRGKGKSNLAHFQKLHLPVGKNFLKKMKSFDEKNRKMAVYRKSSTFRERNVLRLREKYLKHGRSMSGEAFHLYKKEGFSNDHSSYAKSKTCNEQ